MSYLICTQPKKLETSINMKKIFKCLGMVNISYFFDQYECIHFDHLLQ